MLLLNLIFNRLIGQNLSQIIVCYFLFLQMEYMLELVIKLFFSKFFLNFLAYFTFWFDLACFSINILVFSNPIFVWTIIRLWLILFLTLFIFLSLLLLLCCNHLNHLLLHLLLQFLLHLLLEKKSIHSGIPSHTCSCLLLKKMHL